MKSTPARKTAVAEADAVFEKTLKKPQSLCMYCEDEPEARDRLELLLKPHRAHRLGLPVHELDELSLGHGSVMVHQSFRRFAWFVPPLLAATLAAGEFIRGMRRLTDLAQEAGLVGSYQGSQPPDSFTPLERKCLAQFFAATLAALIRETPLDVEELNAALGACEACAIDYAPLIGDWIEVCRAAPLDIAERNLLTAITQWRGDSVTLRALGTEVVRSYLEERTLFGGDPTQTALLSAAESVVREWVWQQTCT